MRKKPGTTDGALEIIDRMIGDDPEVRAGIEEEAIKLEIAQLVYDAREAAGLTQAQLAKRVGTTRSVISRLEDADYRGHSLSMLQRIAKALDLQLSLQFVPLPRRGKRRKAALAT
jgi:ribosome-binding protein aMBF1 (putative translation factor)